VSAQLSVSSCIRKYATRKTDRLFKLVASAAKKSSQKQTFQNPLSQHNHYNIFAISSAMMTITESKPSSELTPWCETMWRRFSGILCPDNPYRTNRFKMYLPQITGAADEKSVADFALDLGDTYIEAVGIQCSWIRDLSDSFRQQPEIPAHDVTVTSKERHFAFITSTPMSTPTSFPYKRREPAMGLTAVRLLAQILTNLLALLIMRLYSWPLLSSHKSRHHLKRAKSAFRKFGIQLCIQKEKVTFRKPGSADRFLWQPGKKAIIDYLVSECLS
jgi:hypothetical protein